MGLVGFNSGGQQSVLGEIDEALVVGLLPNINEISMNVDMISPNLDESNAKRERGDEG